MTILGKIIAKVGDSNPQIFRELKERLTLRNMGIAIAATLIIQGFVLLYFNNQIPIPAYDDTSIAGASLHKLIEAHSKYCNVSTPDENEYPYLGTLCKLDGAGSFKINWQIWRSDVFICLSWILPLGLILGSVYMLVADLVREEKRGTLNFIRLSPQSARNIFIGKILGVPILVYLAVLLAIPLHLWVGFSAGATMPLFASWYLTIGSIWCLLSSAAVLYALLGGVQAIVTVIAVAFPICLPLAVINAFLSGTINHQEWLNRTSERSEQVSWFGLIINSSAVWLYAFGTGCCLVASYWVWQALERRYLNPTATVIGKSQSYLVNLCFQLWIAGFTIPFIFAGPDPNSVLTRSKVTGFAIVDSMALLLLIPMLLPSKQAIQAWSRYRRERVTHQRRKFWQRELIQDWISNDKSPALVAIAINVGMAMTHWIPVSILALTAPTQGMTFNDFSTPGHGIRLLACVCLAASLILIYAAIAHLGLFLKVRKHNLWTVAIVAGVIFLPLAAAFVLSTVRAPTGWAATLLLFSPFAGAGILQLAGGTILAAFTAQLVMFTALTHQLQRKLQIGGQSQTKELLARG
jgi:hypothetical protein